MEVLLRVLKTETQGPLQIRLLRKVFSKKCGASDQQETKDEQYWHPQTNMIIGASK